MNIDHSTGNQTVTEHTIESSLAEAIERLGGNHRSSARIDAETLLGYAMNRSRSYLYTWPSQVLTSRQRRLFQRLIKCRCQGEPVAYLTGQREFWSLPLKVTRDTLIPRPETELLVELALERIPADRSCHIADLGTGSGAIALALAIERPQARLWAVDSSLQALQVGQDNASTLGISNIHWQHGDWLYDYTGEALDLIVANPPYVRSNDPHLYQGDLPYEPRQALVAGPIGLESIDIIIQQGQQHLKSDGWLLLEHGYDQQQQIYELLRLNGYTGIAGFTDLAGQPRLAIGKKP